MHARHDIRRRPTEWVVGAAFRVATRMGGLRPSMVPAHMRRQLAVAGVTDDQLERVLGDLVSLADWPYAWEHEGDLRAAAGDTYAAAVAYYCAQRLLLTATPLKLRLHRLAVDAYQRVDQPPLELLRIPDGRGNTIAGYLQLPPPGAPRRPGQVTLPLVLMVPGVTGMKEELHPLAQPLLRRGIAVARIDSPRYGETTGLLDHDAARNPARVLQWLADNDPRLDAANMHLLGMSMGGFWALHSAVDSPARSAITIAAPFAPEHYMRSLPTMNIAAVQHMTELPDIDAIIDFCEQLTLTRIAREIEVPVRIFHGGRDRTVPVEEAHRLAATLGGPVATTIWPGDHHTCLEHFDDMIAHVLEWVDDPQPVLRAARREAAATRASAAQAARTAPNGFSGAPEPGLA